MKKTTLTLIALFLIFVSFAQNTETFSNIPINNSTSYLDRTWTGDNNIVWESLNSRTDQTINGKAITLRGKSDSSRFLYNISPVAGGCGILSFNYKRVFSGNSTLQVFVNGIQIGSDILVSSTNVTSFSQAVNVSGNITVKIVNITTNKRVVIDDLSWTGFVSSNATDSDAIAPVNPSPQIPGATINSTATTINDAVDVFRMLLRDSGAGDTLDTKVTNIRIKPHTTNTADWTDFIQGVVVYDDNNFITPSNVVITDTYIDISFNVGDLVVPDNDSNNVTIGVYLNTSNILDGKILSFMVDAPDHGFMADPSGSGFATTFPNGSFNSNDFPVNVTATQLQFKQQPTDVVVNTVMAPAVVVAYTDVNGNVDRDINSSSSSATLTANGAVFAGTTTTSGTPTNGLMIFNDIEFISIASNVTLTVTDSPLLNVSTTSQFFDVLAPACNLMPNVIIGQQNFETTPPNPELSYTSTGTALVTGSGAFPTDPKYVSPDFGIEVNNNTSEIIFGPIDTSNFKNTIFSIRLASFAGTSGNGADGGDSVIIAVKPTTTGVYSDELQVSGNNNAKWSFTSGTGEANGIYDGDNSPLVYQPAAGGFRTTDGYSILNLKNLPFSTDLWIKIKISNNSNNEFWVLDDALLKGDEVVSTTWNGTAWSNGVPNNTTKAIFNADYDMNSNPSVTACACTVNNGFKVLVASNKFLEIGNDIVVEGGIKVSNNGSLVQLNKNVNIIGSNFVIERTTTPYRMYDYTYWSSPIENADLNTVFAANPQNNIYSFTTANFDDTNNDSYDDNNDDWTPASGIMTVGKGYIVMGAGAQFPVPNPIPTTTQTQTVQFEGKINNGDITVPVFLDANSSDTYVNQNLIGNPYPSAIYTPAFLAKNTNLTGTLYFWTHNDQISSAITGPDTYNFTNDSYVTYTAGTGGALGNCGGCTTPTDYIASGQSFFADLSQSAGNGTVVFNNSMRATGGNDNFYRMPQSEKNRIWFNMQTNTNDFRQILIGFFDQATNNVDRDYDGKRLENGTNFDFFSLINNEKYAVQGVPSLVDSKTMPIGVEIPVDSQITLSIDRFEGDLDQVNVYLHDKDLQIFYDLKQADYTVDMLQGEYANRFELVFSRNALNTNSNELLNGNNLIVSNTNSQVLVKVSGETTMKNIQVYDVIGKLISNVNLNTNEATLQGNYQTGAVYFVKVTLQNGQTLNKKFIKM